MPFTLQKGTLILQSETRSIPLTEFTGCRTRAFYLYDLDEVVRRGELFLNSGFHIHYAMKANTNPRLLRELAAIGMGVDVVSLGELKRALQAGMDPKKAIFSGVGKVEEDFTVGMHVGIYQFNVESFEELRRLGEFAKSKSQNVGIGLRLNLDIHAPTHPYIQTGQQENKFGIDVRLLPEILPWLKLQTHLKFQGIAVHVGSQIMDLDVFKTVAQTAVKMTEDLKSQGWKLTRLDLGGGLGIDYKTTAESDESRIKDYLQTIRKNVPKDLTVSLEPGRILVARSGVLLGRVLYVKKSSHKSFVILNTGIHHLIRPALYQAFHRVIPVTNNDRKETQYDFVGPLCESSDFIGLARKSPEVFEGEWVAIKDAGAYGRVMASRYNEHDLPVEVCVRKGEVIEVNL